MLIYASKFQVMEYSCLYPMQNKSICSFNLPVHLRMCYCRWLMVDTKIRTISYKFCSSKLSYVIYQNSPGYAEPIYDPLQELDRCFLFDTCH
jgi:hypothetical protein